MFGRLGAAVVRHPWWTIVAWLVTAVVIIAFSPKLSTQADQGDFLPSKYESVQAMKIATAAFPQQEDASALIVVKRTDGKALTAADTAKVTAAAKAMTKPETVTDIVRGGVAARARHHRHARAPCLVARPRRRRQGQARGAQVRVRRPLTRGTDPARC